MIILATDPVDADNHTGREEYDIPDHGTLIMDVPIGWQATFYQPENEAFPIISFHPFKGPQIFRLTVGIFWSNEALQDLTDSQNLRQFVEGVGQNVLKQADEDKLELEKFAGRSGVGYLFDLTDMNAGGGEYKYLTQGAVAVGNVVLVFSLFTNDEQQQAIRRQTMEMLKNARQDLERRDVSYHSVID